MNDPILAKINRWAASDEDRDLDEVGNQIEFLERKLFFDYEPTKGPHPDFWQRLISWLDNVDDADQKILLRLVPYLFFVGREEFDTLYRAAYNGPIAKWLIDQIDMDLNDPAPEDHLREAIVKTWFCPITDSMRINGFYHLNNITSGIDNRPDWLSLSKLGNVQEIVNLISRTGMERLVLLEDFVGGGSQVEEAVKFAASLPCNIPILLLPIIICPKGIEMGLQLERDYPNVTFSKVIALNENDLITKMPITNENDIVSKIRDLAFRVYDKVCGHTGPHNGKPYGPLGYRETGGLIVMYSNCPDNTLPIIHHESNSWKPLFPRSSRI